MMCKYIKGMAGEVVGPGPRGAARQGGLVGKGDEGPRPPGEHRAGRDPSDEGARHRRQTSRGKGDPVPSLAAKRCRRRATLKRPGGV